MQLLRFSLVVAATLTLGAALPDVLANAHAAGADNMAPGMQLQSASPARTRAAPAAKRKATTAKKKKRLKKSERSVADEYRQAYDLIYRDRDYAAAIVKLHALDRGDHPDVANLIGFASRKLGRTEDAKVWYEKALAADPRHARTWQYYGMWHLERGDRTKAESYLKTIQAICGTGCEEYTSLKLALAGDGLIY
jgi:Flp pilus assembly protein TadD